MLHQRASIYILVGQDIAGDFNKIAIQLCIVPRGKGLVHFTIGHPQVIPHQLICFTDQLHIAVFNAVMNHFYKMSGAIFADPLAAGGAVLHLGADGLKNRLDIRPCHWAAAGHHAGALQRTLLSARNTGTNV